MKKKETILCVHLRWQLNSFLSLPSFVVIYMVKIYQFIFRNKVPTCRFLPTCSQYTIEAVHEWGAFRGLLLGGYRILRCHPWAEQRVEEVPLRKDKK